MKIHNCSTAYFNDGASARNYAKAEVVHYWVFSTYPLFELSYIKILEACSAYSAELRLMIFRFLNKSGEQELLT